MTFLKSGIGLPAPTIFRHPAGFLIIMFTVELQKSLSRHTAAVNIHEKVAQFKVLSIRKVTLFNHSEGLLEVGHSFLVDFNLSSSLLNAFSIKTVCRCPILQVSSTPLSRTSS